MERIRGRLEASHHPRLRFIKGRLRHLNREGYWLGCGVERGGARRWEWVASESVRLRDRARRSRSAVIWARSTWKAALRRSASWRCEERKCGTQESTSFWPMATLLSPSRTFI